MPNSRVRVGLVLGEEQRRASRRRSTSQRWPYVGSSRATIAALPPVGARLRRRRGSAASSAATTRCCGTRASAARASGAASGPRLVTRDPDQDVVGVGLGVLDDDVEVAVVVEDAGVDQLELGLRCGRGARFSSTSSAYGNARLRVLVEHPHVRVRRRAVEVEVVLLDVLAVVALGAGQAEEPLLEDRVAAVPQRSAKQMRWWRSQMPARPSSFQR